jgi:hypothetical protein
MSKAFERLLASKTPPESWYFLARPDDPGQAFHLRYKGGYELLLFTSSERAIGYRDTSCHVVSDEVAYQLPFLVGMDLMTRLFRSGRIVGVWFDPTVPEHGPQMGGIEGEYLDRAEFEAAYSRMASLRHSGQN